MIAKIKKTTKLTVLGVALAGLIVGTSSWTKEAPAQPEKKVSQDVEHWDFVGSSTGPDNPLDPSQYQLATGAANCPGLEEICQIQAPADAGSSTPQPDLNAETTPSRTVLDEIESAQTSGPNDYVSMKDN